MNSPVALITGAASGIGQALAVSYARHGVRVVGGTLWGHTPIEAQLEAAEAQAKARAKVPAR